MERDKAIKISLTGPESHTVKIPAGQGSFSIGITGVSKGKFDALVDEDAPIRWEAFDEFYTPAGSPWPRFFHYFGNDTDFVVWSAKRPIEDFFWRPGKAASLDLTMAQINRLIVHVPTGGLTLRLGGKMNYLSISGDLKDVNIESADKIPALHFSPAIVDQNVRRLPMFAALQRAETVEVDVAPVGPAFNCESLLQFTDLVNLNLSGNLTNLLCLAKLEKLERVGVRYAPDLGGFPPLDTWKHLKSFIGWNIEDSAGKRLQSELRVLAAERELDYSSVSKLRKLIWFTTEYGIPFSGWNEKNAKTAVKAYKATLKEIRKAKTNDEAQRAIAEFVGKINGLPNIETSEREDAGTAVAQLIEASGLGIPQEVWGEWFDAARDF
jgi:hypothetical protein